jgi:hypothetical protein
MTQACQAGVGLAKGRERDLSLALDLDLIQSVVIDRRHWKYYVLRMNHTFPAAPQLVSRLCL